ncbi:UDP-2-acetamido-2-deoxy-alpha-D-ribo-hexopyranos-3-ulose 3-aminotransferase [Wenjunlia tyrosinilytica]|uniref:UDP-2-acetamido-2-deoxy-alpha-D-ribo-hexopyranos-3-ulose 3-aminotransferase n=2 Tax=Wenjunlia tyrosinilytica TaxID=1544741 RepID=A0A918E1G1_9ACTN|nr:UDP-2-acetamido-2-deoxy-alpha-D-ribo-hexopyranos-3-ulose 3-aminotransferase [Wenjunlia tyrosinilytica]
MPAIEALLSGGDYILGEAVSDFEAGLADYLGVEHCVGVNSGTDALILTLEALGVGPGYEVVTVVNSFHASALAIARVGAKPVFVDCRPEDFLMDLDQLEAAISARTRAVILVHLFGRAADVTRAARICAEAGIALVEDCAQAIGARWDGKRVGSVSAAGCWSFAPSKNLAAAGDAGAVSTSYREIAERLGLLRHFGQRVQNEHSVKGHNSRLDSIQALVLRHKLGRLEAWNERRVALAGEYQERLAGLPLGFQDPGGPGGHVYHLFQVRTESSEVRDALLSHLLGDGIDAVVRYPFPLHQQPALPHRPAVGAFPVAEALARETLALPIRPDLAPSELQYVCDSMATFFK